jgi:hypothetical protein
MPAPKNPNTAAARAKKAINDRQRKLEAAAELLRGAGWLPLSAEVMADLHGRPAEYIAAVVAEEWKRGQAS